MSVGVVIVAGGRGARLDADQPKQFLMLGRQPMLQHSVDAFDNHPRVDEIVVVLPENDGSGGLHAVSFSKPSWAIAHGGPRRQDSVQNGLKKLSAGVDVVLIHDAARPFVSADLIDRVIDAASAGGAAVPAVRAIETVKQVDTATMTVKTTLPREGVWLAQTPQGFRLSVLQDAHTKNAGADITDEGMLVERAGLPVTIVPGDPDNFKITTPDDLARARGILGAPRVGSGYDLHRLVAGRPLVLAGVPLPFDKGPHGHSDGDVLCHALTDAILGAAAAGDIGRHFSNTDPRWKDAAGLDLLGRAVAIVREAGFTPASADVTVILEQPKLAPHIDAMRANVAGVLGVPMGAVSIKGKTNEGVDAVGRGEAIAAHAVAVLVTSVAGSGGRS
jgi:2-C-methyl-D-erythritol 4-phosphate cytidylyltransferase/2-C-methyl-D-erythritol 2,4-cyclodiphosphate synthase